MSARAAASQGDRSRETAGRRPGTVSEASCSGVLQEDRETERTGSVSQASHPDALHLIGRVRRRAGWEDFGDPPVEPPLSILMGSLVDEAALHPLGRILARIHLRDLLETRLRLARAWKTAEGLSQEEVRAPIFITGMPRSGSTFLHELLALDPVHRAPRVWELMYPVRHGAGTASNGRSRIWRAEANLWWFRRLAPGADAVYPMRARTPHECVVIHSYTLLSQEFVSSFHVPRYEAFLDASDLTPTYAWEKRFLQYLQLGRTAPCWILKSPDHVRSLDALWRVFPDARIIQTHRDPLEALMSSSHLTEVLRGMFSRPQRRRDIGRREARILSENTLRIMQFRDAHPELADRFIDVHYRELTADPVAAVRRIYTRLDRRLPDTVAAAMQALAARRARYHTDGNGHPTLEELGLEPREELKRFEPYCTRFGVGPAEVP